MSITSTEPEATVQSHLNNLRTLVAYEKQTEAAVRAELAELRARSISLSEIAEVLEMSVGNASKVVRQAIQERLQKEQTPTTASDLVRECERGRMTNDDLVAQLKTYPFSPRSTTGGLLDDGDFAPDDWDAVCHAADIDLITDAQYNEILEATQ